MSQIEKRNALNGMIQYICKNAKSHETNNRKEYQQYEQFLHLMLHELEKMEGPNNSRSVGGFWNPFTKKSKDTHNIKVFNDLQNNLENVGQHVNNQVRNVGQHVDKQVRNVGQHVDKQVRNVGQHVNNQVQKIGTDIQNITQNIQNQLNQIKDNMIKSINGIDLQLKNNIATITIIDMINKYTLLCLSNEYMDETYCLKVVFDCLSKYSELVPLLQDCMNLPPPKMTGGGKLKFKKVKITKKILGGEPISFMLIILGVLTSITSLALAIKDKKEKNNQFDDYHKRNEWINKLNLNLIPESSKRNHKDTITLSELVSFVMKSR